MNKKTLRSIVRDAKKKIKDHSELIEDLKEEATHGRNYEDRQEAKENVAYIEGQRANLSDAVNGIKSGTSPEEFLTTTEASIRLLIDEMKYFSGYTGQSLGWRSYITSAIFKFDEDTTLTLASIAGGIDELIDLDKQYAIGLDKGLVRSAKEYATLHAGGGAGPKGAPGPRDWWPARE